AAGLILATELPLAANARRRHPVSSAVGPALTLIGRSMALEAANHRRLVLELLAAEDSATDLDRVLAMQRRDFDRYVVPELVEDHLSATARRDDALSVVQLVGELAAAEKRLELAARLAPIGLAVWGDAGWEAVPGLDYRGSARHTVDLNRIYSSSVVNVDLSRIYQEDIVTMRVFDVLACGGFVLAPHNAQLESLFNVGTELDSYRSLDELYDKCRFYLRNRAKAERIGRLGRSRVLRDHTVRHRVKTMLASVSRDSRSHSIRPLTSEWR
ncbi:MAG: glycosyltransferase, partial [Myxococcota bacterium]